MMTFNTGHIFLHIWTILLTILMTPGELNYKPFYKGN
jgi:hypothetical protein